MANRSPNPSSKPDQERIQEHLSSPPGKQKVKKLQKRLRKDQGQKVTNQKQQTRLQKVPKKRAPKNRKTWRTFLLAIAVLSTTGGLLVTIAWVSILFIFNPSDLRWVNQLLPVWARISVSRGEDPQTLTEITGSLSQQQLQAGEVVALDGTLTNSPRSFLLPVLREQANCQSDCQKITELRVYQQAEEREWRSLSQKYYHLTTKLPIAGPEESFVIAPLGETEEANQGSSITLGMNQVGLYEEVTPDGGWWFYLRGERLQGTKAIAYGQIVFYNPQRERLQQMLSWTSPSGKLPQWQQVTGNQQKELVVEQTIGLEPLLKVYQLETVNLFFNPFFLKEITLQQPALDEGGYENALVIARSGLWTPAWQWLQSIQKQRKGAIPADAQAQMDLIRLHSQLTKTLADKNWAAPSQQVLAYLIDGRWEKALQVFTTSTQNGEEIFSLLKADGGRLWQRTQAALEVNPNRSEVQIWAALILTAREGQQKANSWLDKQSQVTPATRTQIQQLWAQLSGELSPTQVNSHHPSRIVGTATKNAAVKAAAWLPLTSKEDLIPKNNQIWYQIEVNAFHNGQSWQYLPFTQLKLPADNPSQYLQKVLGIQANATIDIINWLPNQGQQSAIASLKAVQWQNGVLTLLAVATTTPEQESNAVNHQSPALAVTTGALEWVQPSPINFDQFYQQQPEKAAAMMQKIWQSLQASGDISAQNNPQGSQLRQKLANIPVQIADVTNDTVEETLVTISPDVIPDWQQKEIGNQEASSEQTQTIIFADNGDIIYSELKTNNLQRLKAIAKLPTVNSPVLLVKNDNKYTLQRWSQANQRFE